MPSGRRSPSEPKSSLLSKIVIDTRPLRIGGFRRLWMSNIVFTVGSQFTIVAVPKQVYDITGSSAYVGLTGAAALLPLLVFGLWGGAIADTVDRRKMIIFSNAGSALSLLIMWLQAWLAINNVWLVLGLLVLVQSFASLGSPARNAVVPRLVSDELVPSAVALNTTVFNFGAIFGPLLAGLLIPFIGLSTLYILDSFALSLALLAVLSLPAMPPLTGPSRRAGLRDILDGFRYLRTQKILMASYVLDLIAMIAGMPMALFPEMAERTFGDPPGGGIGLGWLYAAIPLGSLVVGVTSGWLSRVSRHGVGVVVGVCAWGLAIVGFGLSDSLVAAVIFLAIGGAADFVSMVYRNSMLQSAATDEMRGRLQGIFTVVVAGGPRLSHLLHGWAAAGFGTAVAASGGGVLTIVLAIVAAILIPSFWRYRVPRREPEPAA